MDWTKAPQTVLGLDIGQVHTRTSLMGVSDGSFRMLGTGLTKSSWCYEAGLIAGVIDSLQNLEQQSGRMLWRQGQQGPQTFLDMSNWVDQTFLTLSGGPRPRLVVMGLTEAGSIRAAQALAGSLPLDLIGTIGLDDVRTEQAVLTWFVQNRPDVVLIAGGENDGAVAPVRLLVEIVRLACLLLPNAAKPKVIYAGNPEVVNWVRRRLDPLVTLTVVPNLQPAMSRFDLLPAQNHLNDLIVRSWAQQVHGLEALGLSIGPQLGTKPFLLSRMVRFLSRAYGGKRGVLAVDLGGGSTTLAANLDDRSGLVEMPAWEISGNALREIVAWSPVPVGVRTARMYLNNHALHPSIIPSDVMELALSQSLARYRLRTAMAAMVDRFPGFYAYPNQGLVSNFEPIIASGSVLTHAPTAGQSMLIMLDALQPRGVTTMVLDRYHILPLLGAMGGAFPILPVQIMDSNAFLNLGTVISPVSPAPAGKTIMVVRVTTDAGERYTAEVIQGMLRRLPLPSGMPARLTLKPTAETDIGFGGPGVGGRLAVTGGALGLVVDARGRPLALAEEEEERLEQLRQWLWALGG